MMRSSRVSVVWAASARRLLWPGVFLLALPATSFAQAQSRPMQAPKAAVKLDDVPGEWLSRVSGEIRRSEYGFSKLEDEGWSAPNQAHGLRFRVGCSGIEVNALESDSSAGESGFRLLMRAATFGRGKDSQELAPRDILAVGNRAERDLGILTEWFVNDERGIEQGWTIERQPGGDPAEMLWIGLHIEGDFVPQVEPGGRGALFVSAEGKGIIRYSGLLACDVSGRELKAELVSGPMGFGVRVDDTGARYPITVDPLLTGPAWTAESEQEEDRLGYSVAPAGDVNGDGYADVIVGAPYFGGYYFSLFYHWGKAYLYLGSAAGLATSPAWTVEGELDTNLGFSVSTAGDVNGDGYSDVLVGRPAYDQNDGGKPGEAYLYLGSAAGLGAYPVWRARDGQLNAEFGQSVSAAGDVNGDGYSDVLIGEEAYVESARDRVYLYLGSAAGLPRSPAWTGVSNQAFSGYGASISTAGDVNGDGYSDVLVGAPSFNFRGRAFLYLGAVPTEWLPIPLGGRPRGIIK